MKFEDLKGKKLTQITVNALKDEMRFKTEEGETFRLYHEPDCCELVTVEDINGDLNDLLETPLLLADESISEQMCRTQDDGDTQTWTFYRLATIKGYVNIRWVGRSNGYYSESVSFERVKSDED